MGINVYRDLIYEKTTGGVLTPLLAGPAILSDDTIRTWMLLLLHALETLHGFGVVHRDLKADNVVLVEPLAAGTIPVVKIGDFGQARVLTTSKTQITPPSVVSMYRAPEVFSEILNCESDGRQFSPKKLDPRMDVWSLGVIFAKMLPRKVGSLRRPPFIPTGPSEKHVVKAILVQFGWREGMQDLGDGPPLPSLFDEFKCYDPNPATHTEELNPGNAVHPDAVDMLRKMLCFRWEDRWSCYELLEHPYMSLTDDAKKYCPTFARFKEHLASVPRPPRPPKEHRSAKPKDGDNKNEAAGSSEWRESPSFPPFNDGFDNRFLESPFLDYNVVNTTVGPVPAEAARMYAELKGMLYREIVDIHKYVFGLVQRPFPLPPRHNTWVVRQSGQRILALTYPTVRPLPVLVEAVTTPSDSEDEGEDGDRPARTRRRPVHQEVHEEFVVRVLVASVFCMAITLCLLQITNAPRESPALPSIFADDQDCRLGDELGAGSHSIVYSVTYTPPIAGPGQPPSYQYAIKSSLLHDPC